MKLTIKQENFAMRYVELGNASEAYRRSYNAENMSDDTIKVKACNLLKKDNVRVTVEELKAKNAKKHEVTVDSLTKELDEIIELAKGEKHTSAAITGVMGKAKLHGKLVDRVKAEMKTMSQVLDELEAME